MKYAVVGCDNRNVQCSINVNLIKSYTQALANDGSTILMVVAVLENLI